MRGLRAALLAFSALATFALLAAPASAAPTFAPAVQTAVGGDPVWLDVADMDGDGHVDVVTSDTFGPDQAVKVFLGDGTGALTLLGSYPNAHWTPDGAIADFNGDDVPDVVTANVTDNTMSVFLGDGSGALGPRTAFPVMGGQPNSVATGDIDGDMDIDIVTGNAATNDATVFLNDGSGSFTIASQPSVCNSAEIALRDLDGDNRHELIVASFGCSEASVLHGNGDGTFDPAVTYPLPAPPEHIAEADFDEDNDFDLVFAMVSNNVAVLENDGTGSFSASVLHVGAQGGQGIGLAPADYDFDGNLDLAVAANNDDSVGVRDGDGAGGFVGPLASFPVGDFPYGLRSADLNEDGKPDLISVNLLSGDLSVLLNTTADTTPPTLNLPANITTEADGPGGSEVAFTVTATDNLDPNPSVSCTPPSGSLFPIGTTNVNCTATDNSGNVANGSFTVTVTDTERSDIEIEKFASHTKASPGQNVTYSFRVTNHGPSTAHNVTVRDPGSAHLNFISADPGCSVVASEIVCNFGTLANGATQTKNVVLQLHPAHHSGEAPSQHDLDILKLEQFVSVPGNELNYPEHSLSCPAGYTATDGSARTDSVGQGTGTRPGEHDVENLHFVRSESNGVDRRRWDFTLQNHATGQAQAHLFIVCLKDETSSNNGHFHALIHHPRVTGVLTIPAAGGRHEITRTCPVNTVAIAPSFEFTTTGPAPPAGGPNGPHGPQYKSIQSADGRSWTFGFQTAAAARVEVSIRCLARETSSAAGHFEALNFHHVYKRVTVGGFAGFGNSGPWTEARAECPVHYKGITATWRFPRNVKPMGNTPEPINRDFRIFNKSPQPKYAHIDLLCLKNRTMDDLNGGSVRNNATVYADEPDWNFANNLDFWDLEDPPLDPSGGGSPGGDSGGSGDAGDTGGGDTGGESGEPGVALAPSDEGQAKLESCVKRALKIANKKKRRKAVKSCRSRYGAD